MATAHLVYGYLGVGKSTFARALAAQEQAVLIQLDEWYLRLFSDGPTTHLDAAALDRLWAVLNGHWPQVLRSGASVVLDFGFWSRHRRDEARRLALDSGAEYRLHWVQCDDDVAVQRCQARNVSGTLAFVIDEAAYRNLRPKFEPLGDDEHHVAVNSG